MKSSRNYWGWFQWNKGDSAPNDNLMTDERKQRLKWRLRLMIALALPVFLETLDYTVVATAQPHIASAFNRLDLQSYIGTIYLLTSTVFLPLFASFADAFGRHWAMQLSLLLFLFGSALSTAAQNMPMMLAGRGIAGVGAAGLLTVVRVILADSASLDDNNFQASILTFLYAIGFSLGPVIGGALTSISFRWVFAINLPCCVVSMVLVFLLIRAYTKHPLSDEKLNAFDKLLLIDWIAAALFISGGILLLLGLNWGSSEGWGGVKVILCLVLGALMVGATICWEAILEHKQERAVSAAVNGGLASSDELVAKNAYHTDLPAPLRATALLPLNVLWNYDVLATSFAAFTSGMVMLVVFYFVAIFMVIVSGKSAVNAGVQLIYFSPGMGVGTIVSIMMVKRLRQPKYPIILGSSIIPVALGLISNAINRNKGGQVSGFMVMGGVGVGLTFGPLSLHARYSQPSSRVAIVVAVNLFFRALGGTVGLAQCGAVLNAKIRAYFASLPASALADLQGANGTFAGGASDLTSLGQIDALPSAAQALVRNAYRSGVRWSFISLIPWACVSLIGCLFLRRFAEPDPDTPTEPKVVSAPERKRSAQESHEMDLK